MIVGMEADVIIKLEDTKDALRVMNECIYTDDNGNYLFVVDKNKTVRKRYVSVGVRDSSYTQILNGRNERDMIVNDLSAAEYEDEKIKPVTSM